MADTKKTTDLQEQLLAAMDIIADYKLQTLQFDKTVKGTIIKDKGYGVYQIQGENVKYDACATNDTTYNVNDEVFILIPNGDWSSQKIISGKVTLLNNTDVIDYVSPLQSIIQTNGLISSDTNGLNIWKISANGKQDSVQRIDIATINVSAHDALKNNYMYDTLCLKAEFKTLFGKDDIRSGAYGIGMRVTFDGDPTKVKMLLFDSSVMFGDPYNYMTYFPQEAAFDISKGEDKVIAEGSSITSIDVFLYEDGNFKYFKNGELIPYPKPKYDNILVKNIQVTLGNNVFNVKNNTFRIDLIGSEEDFKYGALGDTNKRTIRSTWYKYTDAGETIGFSDGVVDAEGAYDEETYRSALETEWAGAADQIPEDMAPLKEALQINYNADKLNKSLRSTYDLVGGNVKDAITAISKFVAQYQLQDEDLDSKYAALEAALEEYQKQLMNALGLNYLEQESWEDTYADYLKAINTEYTNFTDEKQPNYVIKVPTTDINVSFLESITTAYKNFNTAFSEWATCLQALGETDITAYVDRYKTQIYDTQYKKLIETQQSEAKALLEANSSQITKLTERLNQKDLTTFKEEYDQFLKANENYYDIYWYRKNDAAPGDEWSGTGWERIPTDAGKPMEIGTDGRYEQQSQEPLTIVLKDSKEEQIKAILFYNHEQHTSNILTFTNINYKDEASAGGITIEHGRNSQAHFAKYQNIFILTNSADAMLNRELSVKFNSPPEGKSNDDMFANATVYWYIPKQGTMLAYYTDILQQRGYATEESFKDPETGLVLDDYKQYIREGYYCFYKKTSKASDAYFYYRIANIFQQSATLNTIKCMIEKSKADGTFETFEDDISFTFGVSSTAGTVYNLNISPVAPNCAIGPGGENPLYVEVNYSRYDGTAIEQTPTITVDWETKGTNPYIYAPTPEELAAAGIEEREGSLYRRLNRNIDLNKDSLYSVLYAEVVQQEESQTLTLRTHYPVARAANNNYYLDGPTTIIYDGAGVNPEYIRKPYKLFKRDTNEEILDVSWDILYYDSQGELYKENSDVTHSIYHFLPSLEWENGKKYSYLEAGTYLKPVTMYVTGIDIYCVVVARKNGAIIYAQPIYIGQNQWESSLLNAWNEKLTIDEENNIVLSAMIGAGSKDNENRFNGVLMGEVGAKAGYADVKTGIGLYGFHEGVQSFGFNIDGTAFLGKTGQGRIEFDGNNAIIRSGNYWSNKYDGDGMQIDLSTGHIDAYNFKLTSKNITIDTSGNPNYFFIQSNNQTPLIRISDDEYFLQTADYYNVSEHPENEEESSGEPQYNSGTRLDLQSGKLISHNFSISALNNVNTGLSIASEMDDNLSDTIAMSFLVNSTPILYLSDGNCLLQSINNNCTPQNNINDNTSTVVETQVIGKVLYKSYNIRTGPSTSASILTSTAYTQIYEIEIYSETKNNEWCRIKSWPKSDTSSRGNTIRNALKEKKELYINRNAFSSISTIEVLSSNSSAQGAPTSYKVFGSKIDLNNGQAFFRNFNALEEESSYDGTYVAIHAADAAFRVGDVFAVQYAKGTNQEDIYIGWGGGWKTLKDYIIDTVKEANMI